MRIKNVDIPFPVALAPMAGVCDSAFRQICKEHGAGYVVSEMISARALHYSDKKTVSLMDFDSSEHPFAMQIFGNEQDMMAQAAEFVQRLKPDIIDINMGCPTPKIVNNGDGSALLKDIKKAALVCESVAKSTVLPVTVKIRLGWDEQSKNYIELARALEQSGASAICVHGRTREQFYSGKADWSAIYKLKNAISIPVFANGDITTPEQAKSVFEQTGCDGIMIGRAALGNPFIFNQIKSYLQTGSYLQATKQEKISTAKQHIKMIVAQKGEKIGILQARKHAAWYLKGFCGSAQLKTLVNSAATLSQMENYLDMALNNKDV